mgnify:CR=1 FL=1
MSFDDFKVKLPDVVTDIELVVVPKFKLEL